MNAAGFFGVLLCCTCYAQSVNDQTKPGHPDFTGTWVLQEGSSSSTLHITHREPEIKIIHELKNNKGVRANEGSYFSDNRGEKNVPFIYFATPTHSVERVKSTTRWDGNKLVIKYSVRLEVPSDTLFFDVAETWELSQDRNFLNHTMTFSNIKAAFNKSMAAGFQKFTNASYRRLSSKP